MTICPVNFKTVDHTVVRIAALLSVLLLVVGVIADSIWILAAVTADFLFRASGLCSSPLASLASATAAFFDLPKKPVDQGAKLFAARMGTAGLFAALALIGTGWVFTGWLIALIVAFFSLLEGLFGFCVACSVYTLIFRPAKQEHL